MWHFYYKPTLGENQLDGYIFINNYYGYIKVKKYLIEQGIPLNDITVEEINNWLNPKVNKNGFFVVDAFKITII